jgi:hypothetical protein
MSRSYFPTTLIPRSFFPDKKGNTIALRNGELLTVGSDKRKITDSFYLTDGNAKIWLYFKDGFVSMYDMSYTDAWKGTGEELLRKIRCLIRGKFKIRYPKKQNDNKIGGVL